MAIKKDNPLLPKEMPENITVPELERWLELYAQEIFPMPKVSFGGAVRRAEALRECVKIVFKLQAGNVNDLIIILKRHLGLTARKIREDYLTDLVESGVIRANSPNWEYKGKRPE